MNDIYSFYQLISKYQIEIPIIQRDYAQGRDNTKAADVRKSLVEKMKIAVEDEDKSLFFDFVYGRIDGNKFIPFDGQQRLTSLFLFHKYVFEKCQSESNCRHNGNCICKEILKRFSYATRQSSRDFCEKLVQENVIPSDDKKVSDNIKNLSWFYPDWQKDPTIIGMLTMLDEIHNQMNGKKNVKVVAEKLTSGCNCPITFHFVDMGEHKLSDETYVKMNARGKQLTPFENFKASLEQYLEEKNEQKLLSRLKGKYDESKQKYTGIDGSWLDLFWEVTNKNKQENEGKELPDSLMMSFFNRHFMNVWRCWYENNSKTEKERENLSEDENNKQKEWDRFNSRIKKEMPFYPTKDDFVSFSIYRYVIDNCGTECCLTPIFNICDALITKVNNIENDCQAVWNRDKETTLQWDLYQGDKNKNNRETYPSRVAFYALMKYFKTSPDTNSLAQWMRVVWNITENSTIDSEETYHAALRLIDELSEHSHQIYEFLNNPSSTIKSKHAEMQVNEEITKAKQILEENNSERKYAGGNKKSDGSDYILWEEIIKDAEKYAFFKGAIRFLFTDGNWDAFDTKWANAQKYFDEIGVKKDFKVKLTESLVIQCDNWNDQLYDKQIFNPNASTWKWILCSSIWKMPIHNILLGDLDRIQCSQSLNDDNINKYFTPLLNDMPYKTYIEVEPTGRFRWIDGRLAYYKPYGRRFITFDWGEFHRNAILRQIKDSITIGNDNPEIKDSKLSFWWGWNINFKYPKDGNPHIFQWNADGNVYLIDNNERKKQSDGSDFLFSATGLNNKDVFINKLDCIIAQAFPNANKSVYEECQDR